LTLTMESFLSLLFFVRCLQSLSIKTSHLAQRIPIIMLGTLKSHGKGKKSLIQVDNLSNLYVFNI
jgi:hypothetical protein